MNARFIISRWTMSVMTLALLSLTLSAEPSQRKNALAKYYPEGLANMPPESQKMALEYITGWMSVFSALRTSGIAKTDNLRQAYEQELLPIIQPLKEGTKFEKEAFEAGTKIYEALNYLGSRLSTKAAFENSDLNALIRYQPGNERDPSLLSEGVGELLYDYVQLVAPDLFEQAPKQREAQQK